MAHGPPVHAATAVGAGPEPARPPTRSSGPRHADAQRGLRRGPPRLGGCLDSARPARACAVRAPRAPRRCGPSFVAYARGPPAGSGPAARTARASRGALRRSAQAAAMAAGSSMSTQRADALAPSSGGTARCPRSRPPARPAMMDSKSLLGRFMRWFSVRGGWPTKQTSALAVQGMRSSGRTAGRR